MGAYERLGRGACLQAAQLALHVGLHLLARDECSDALILDALCTPILRLCMTTVSDWLMPQLQPAWCLAPQVLCTAHLLLPIFLRQGVLAALSSGGVCVCGLSSLGRLCFCSVTRLLRKAASLLLLVGSMCHCAPRCEL
jgi:hypothetical protein